MTPEERARQGIDRKLEAAGWVVQDFRRFDPRAGHGIAVREYPTDTGPADYVLFVDRKAVGVIEAKRDEAAENLTATEHQTERYATSLLKWRIDTTPLPFLFECTGQIVRFTDGRDPRPRSREVFSFFRAERLAEWCKQAASLRGRLATDMPSLPTAKLRDCQITAVSGLERSLATDHPRALVHMATGAAKTFDLLSVLRNFMCYVQHELVCRSGLAFI